MHKTYPVSLIADWFLAKNREDIHRHSAEAMTNNKLQKLLYFAQGCALGMNGIPLFKEPILAWSSGPVVEKLYLQYSSLGEAPLPNDHRIDFSAISEEDLHLLEEVNDTFGIYSAWGLFDMIREDDVWQKTGYKDIIPNDALAAHFEENYLED